MGCLAAVYINNQYKLILSMLVFQGVVKFDAVCRGAIQHISLTKNEGVGEGGVGGGGHHIAYTAYRRGEAMAWQMLLWACNPADAALSVSRADKPSLALGYLGRRQTR